VTDQLRTQHTAPSTDAPPRASHRAPISVHVWSDIICPWCYIGKRRLERALEASNAGDRFEVVHRSFQLDQTSPRAETLDRKQMLTTKYGWSTIQLQEADARLMQIAKSEGLDYHLAGGLTGNTLDAHQVLHLGRERGVQGAVVERLFKGYFTEQRSVFDHESLAAMAAEAGLDVAEVRQVLAQDRYVAAVAEDVSEARSLGATGVPFFVFDQRFGLSGAQPLERFQQAIARVLE
jgi:predicted DsbA family dithiol-disulfide isomerase